ncbi:helix-turn-helix domain-containing protein [Mediterraneibacter massiliensis]|jgi:transcriptional regulator with XRE-family HTH domain|uniref:helix-turn-helix domain-containing protein n=1 Tax=Mediterraneibacter massiliensis TaxID=1720300 RepID=UPI0022E546C0|nr:XRE family transcriptional regulator [Mediterraneibacter massiliensis]
MGIYDKVKILAKKKGVTIQQMEIDLHLSDRNSCKWNSVLPRADTLKKVADYFGVSIEYFLE